MTDFPKNELEDLLVAWGSGESPSSQLPSELASSVLLVAKASQRKQRIRIASGVCGIVVLIVSVLFLSSIDKQLPHELALQPANSSHAEVSEIAITQDEELLHEQFARRLTADRIAESQQKLEQAEQRLERLAERIQELKYENRLAAAKERVIDSWLRESLASH